jgi:ubiquinone/menaquinone biosynthesis C-methylase UbiE
VPDAASERENRRVDFDLEALRLSGYSAPGFAARYDANRPRPAPVLLDLLPFAAGLDRPQLVVDLGSGTGLSTRFWAGRAEAVVGIEPNPEMLRHAESVTSDPNVRYVNAPAHATSLPDECADIVTASQSLQWMEPEPTIAEIGRILRPSGIFAPYRYSSLVTRSAEADEAWAETRLLVGELRRELGLDAEKRRWPVSRERLEESGRFGRVTETYAHSVETGDADRLVGFLLSEGSVSTLLEHVSEEAIGLDRLREVAARTLGAEPSPWYLGYQVWICLK